jgi:hypothetical protein
VACDGLRRIISLRSCLGVRQRMSTSSPAKIVNCQIANVDAPRLTATIESPLGLSYSASLYLARARVLFYLPPAHQALPEDA